MRASPVRIVKGEQPGFDFFNGKTGDRAGKLGGKNSSVGCFGIFDIDQAVTQLQTGFQRLRQPLFDAGFGDNTVNNDFNIVLLVFV